MPREITAEEFDERFDSGEDVSEYLDWEHAYVEQPKARQASPSGQPRRQSESEAQPHPTIQIVYSTEASRSERLDERAESLGISRDSLLDMAVDQYLATA